MVLSLTQQDSTQTEPASWLLEGLLPDQRIISQTPIRTFPYLIGRDPVCDLAIRSGTVSKKHARIMATQSAILIEDLNSTNGTFVNGIQIFSPTPIGVGDLIQLAELEFRIFRESPNRPDATCVTQELEQKWLISRMKEVLDNRRFQMHFQPIVCGNDQSVLGYEALVRTDVKGLESPINLFKAARQIGQEIRLSRMCRVEAVQVMAASSLPGALFLNTVPAEPLDEALLQSLKELRRMSGQRRLVLEVHERALPGVDAFRQFATALREIDVQIAFDDFGVGQSRLMELAQVKPDFLKFDRSLVKDLGKADTSHYNLIKNLHDMARALGIRTVAEGLECPIAIEACKTIGFELMQGYAFGMPSHIDQLYASRNFSER